MMQWLNRVIGMVRNIIQPASPVRPTQATPIGGSNSTVAQRKRQPATQGSKAKPKPVKAVTPVRSPKTATSLVRTPTKKSKVAGIYQATPVKRQSAQKPKLLTALSTIQVKSLSKEPSQQGKLVRGKQSATPVPQILRPAKPQSIVEPKPAVQTKAVKKPIKKRTPAQTPMDRKSKGNGS